MRDEPSPKHAHEVPVPAAGGRAVGFAVITVSDTRTPDTDASGALAKDSIVKAGHRVVLYVIVKDESGSIRAAVDAALSNPEVAIVFLTGGTGISRRDVTPESVEGCFEKPLPGFGELFRHLSYAEIGPSTILSRATAGLARGRALFVVPGSRAAVKLALDRLVIPEAGHLAAELQKRG